MMSSSSSNRRRFLQTAASAAAFPLILPGRVWSQETAPSKKLTVGCVGTGKQMGGLMGQFLSQDGVQVVAVCDVDTTRRTHAKEVVDKKYGNTDCKAFNDFREITENPAIDLVCIATPDHWHAIISISALTHGKDVYCEKPLTHNIHEAVRMVEVARANKRVLQTGSMQRSMGEFRTACELVRNGVIGEVKTCISSFGDPAKPNANPQEDMEPGLDWDRWCGPAPLAPYSSVLSPRGVHNHFPKWRETREYGGGYVCDWGAHQIDILQWGLGMDENGPVQVIAPENFETAKRGAQLVYANGITITHQDGVGASFYGTEGEVHVNRGKFELKLKGERKFGFLDKEKDTGTSVEREYTLASREFLTNAKVSLYKSKNQIADFLDCVKTRQKPVCDVGIGASSAICCHLMNLAYYHGQKFGWDPIKHEFTSGGDPKWLTREYRGEWKVA